MPAHRNPRSASRQNFSRALQTPRDDASTRSLASDSSPTAPTAAASLPLVSRRSHAKSKRGCRTCKRRKVKCDEQHPSCGNCIKHGVACDFVMPQHGPGSAPVLSGSPDATQSSPTVPVHRTNVILPSLPDVLKHDGGNLNMIDLQLLHNFTTFTYMTLSSNSSFRHMLKTTAINMAFECEFLMRTILGLSALHLARFRHNKADYYIHVGLNHYQVASRLATRLMDDLERLTREDCEHLHLFAVLTLFFALGSPKQDQDSLILGDAIVPGWLTMLRSAEPILRVLDPSTYKGALGPLFSYGRERWRVLYGETPCKENSFMVDLQTAVNRSCSDPELLSIYNGVIDHLRNVLGRLMPQPPNNATQARQGSLSGPSTPASTSGQLLPASSPLEAWDIFVWQWDAAKDFIPLLRGAAPYQEAMTIYAHFLIMLKKLDTQWWLEGWAIHIMERVWACLDDEYKPWIQWPIQEIGWVPP